MAARGGHDGGDCAGDEVPDGILPDTCGEADGRPARVEMRALAVFGAGAAPELAPRLRLAAETLRDGRPRAFAGPACRAALALALGERPAVWAASARLPLDDLAGCAMLEAAARALLGVRADGEDPGGEAAAGYEPLPAPAWPSRRLGAAVGRAALAHDFGRDPPRALGALGAPDAATCRWLVRAWVARALEEMAPLCDAAPYRRELSRLAAAHGLPEPAAPDREAGEGGAPVGLAMVALWLSTFLASVAPASPAALYAASPRVAADSEALATSGPAGERCRRALGRLTSEFGAPDAFMHRLWTRQPAGRKRPASPGPPPRRQRPRGLG